MHNNVHEIKEYSSLFATKINYILDKINVAPIQHGRAKAIEQITNEKGSTVNNWLFNGKLPRDNKKLAISDAIGVSYDYLFDDNIEISSIRKPEIYDDGQCYLIPYIENSDVFNLKNYEIFPINKRYPIMFPNFHIFIEKYGKNLYITKINDNSFEPHIQMNSDVIYSEKVIFDDFRFVIGFDKNCKKVVVKRIIYESGQIFLESFNKNGNLTKEIVNKNDEYVSVVLTYSS